MEHTGMPEIITTNPWVVYAVTLEGQNKTYFGCCKNAAKRFSYLRKELRNNRGMAPKFLQDDYTAHGCTAESIHFWVIQDDLNEQDAYRITGELVQKYRTYEPERGWNQGYKHATRQLVHIHKGLPDTLIGG